MNEREIEQALALAEQSLHSALGGPVVQQQQAPQVDPRVLHDLVDTTVRQHLSNVPVISGPPGLDGRTPRHEDIRPIVEEVVAKIEVPKGEKGEKGDRGPKGPPGDKVRIVERITDPRRMQEPDGASLVGYTPFGIGASTETVSAAIHRLPHTAQYDTTAHFNTAMEALTGTFGMHRLAFKTPNVTDATYTMHGYTVNANDTWQVGYNLSETLYIPNDTAEPQIWFGMESKYPNNAARDPTYGTDASSEIYWRYSPIGNTASTGYLEPLFFNFDRVQDKIIRGDIRAEHLTFANTDSTTLYIEITPTAWSLTTKNLTATDSRGTIGSGTQASSFAWIVGFTGDAGGTTSLVGEELRQTASGGNAVTLSQTVQVNANTSATNTVTTLSSGYGLVTLNGSGNVNTAKGWRSGIAVRSSGAVTVGEGFVSEAPIMTSTGTIGTYIGFRADNLGHATLITTSICFDAAEQTKSASLSVGFRGLLSSGTGKYNLYMIGTATNYLQGGLVIGGTAVDSTGTQVLTMTTGTAPNAGVADTVQFYSSDDAAGHTIPSFYCEGTNVIATGQADSTSSVRVRMRINGTVVTLLAI